MKRTGPDSVASWIAASWGCFIGMVLFGMVRLSGMLFVASMDEFQVDREQASFPYILCDVTQAIIGPLTGYLACKYGTRPVLVLGSLLAAVGIGTNFSAENIETVTFLWGIVFGLGFGLCCPVFPIIITQHFVKKRATAIGIMYIGTYLGISVLPPILEHLIEVYGLHGTFLWLSGMVLQCVPVSMLIHNPDKKRRNYINENMMSQINQITGHLYAAEKYIARRLSSFEIDLNYSRKNSVSSTQSSDNDIKESGFKASSKRPLETISEHPCQELSMATIIEQTSVVKHQEKGDPFPITTCGVSSRGLLTHSGRVIFHSVVRNSCHLPCTESEVPVKRQSIDKITPSAAFKVFLEPVFILVLLSMAVYTCSFIAFMTIIVDFTRDIGLEVTDGKYIILGFSIASNIGLVCFGWVTDYGYMSLTSFSGLVFLLRAITTAVLTCCHSFPMLLTVVMLQGLFEASNFNVLPLIIADYYSEDVHEVAISCSFVLSGPVHLSIPLLISFFRDGWGSYNYLFYLMSGASLVCSVLLFLAPILAKFRCVKDEKILRDRSSAAPAVMA